MVWKLSSTPAAVKAATWRPTSRWVAGVHGTADTLSARSYNVKSAVQSIRGPVRSERPGRAVEDARGALFAVVAELGHLVPGTEYLPPP